MHYTPDINVISTKLMSVVTASDSLSKQNSAGICFSFVEVSLSYLWTLNKMIRRLLVVILNMCYLVYSPGTFYCHMHYQRSVCYSHLYS